MNINTFDSHCFPHSLVRLPKHSNESGTNGPVIHMFKQILKRVHACTPNAEYKDEQSGTQCSETTIFRRSHAFRVRFAKS